LRPAYRARHRREARRELHALRRDQEQRIRARLPRLGLEVHGEPDEDVVTQFLQYTVLGIVTGAVYAIAATGLVVTYSTSGIFNIAHGAIGMVMAFLYWELRINHHWPAPIALFIVVFVAAPLLGAVIERTLMRRLRGASVAQSLVVTVGFLVLLLGVGEAIWKPTVARELAPFFDPKKFKLLGVFVSWHDAITILVGIAVAIFLYIFLARTRIGIAMRAVVDDRNLLSLNGARPDRVSMLSWAVGASLASLAGIPLAPSLQMNHLVLTLLAVNAYAAAMVGRLRSLPFTSVGGIALGMMPLVPLTGYGGQVSLARMAFAGLGAFAMAKVGANGNIFGIIAAAGLAAAVGALSALPALRLQGLYRALSTMAFAILMEYM